MEFLVLIELKLELNDHFDKPTRKDGLQIFFACFESGQCRNMPFYYYFTTWKHATFHENFKRIFTR